MSEKIKKVAVGTAKEVAKLVIPGVPGALAGKKMYDECQLNGDGSLKTAFKVSATAIGTEAAYRLLWNSF
jgi:hypothetical protein